MTRTEYIYFRLTPISRRSQSNGIDDRTDRRQSNLNSLAIYRPFLLSIRHTGLYAKIMAAEFPWWHNTGKYAKHMLNEWINKRLTGRIEIKAKLNDVDERLNFLLLKNKIVHLLCFLEWAHQKTITLHFSSGCEIIYGGDVGWRQYIFSRDIS